MKRYLVVLGTRPEAIKLAPLIHASLSEPGLEIEICSTGQHKEMLEQVLDSFKLSIDHKLNLMTADQSLSDLHSRAVLGVHTLLEETKYDGVIVQGDTSTAFAGALAAFHLRVPIVHVEAGLRTNDLENPFPEEANRILIDTLASVCAAPTTAAAENLRNAGIPDHRIHVTGNTAIDSLLYIRSLFDQPTENPELRIESLQLASERQIITVTGHRRESFGKPFENICSAIRSLALTHPDVQIVYPVHLNPNVSEPVRRMLGGIENVKLTAPLPYEQFVQLLASSRIILTDSGGIQEEAPSLNVPILVMRETTERPEGIDAGCARLVGVSEQSIVEGVEELLNSPSIHRKMSEAQNPYGDGHAVERILKLLRRTPLEAL